MKKKSNINILFLLHLPLPVHGSSMVGKSIKESQLINNTFNCRFVNLMLSRKIEDTGKRSFYKIFRFVIVWLKILIELFKKKPSICYFALTTTGSAFYKDLILIAHLKLFGIKRVYHLHNKGVSKHHSNKIKSILYKFVFDGSDVILLSELLYPDVQKYVLKSHAFFCPNGIEDNFSEIVLTTQKVPNINKILFLSNLIESKGIYVLIDACSILVNRGIDINCDIIGGEGDISISRLNEVIKMKGLSSRIKYLGKKYNEEKNHAFTEASIFVLPTFYSNECFPLVLLEAMQFSLPIVSTFEGGIPDIVENGITGFLVPQHDPITLADKIEMLIINPLIRLQMGKMGRKKYEKNFTMKIFEHRLVEILQLSMNQN